MLSDTLSDLDKLNQGEYSKYQLCSSKIDIHMFICYFSKRLIKRLSDTLSDLEKLNQGEYSKYQLCSSNIDMTHVYMLFKKKIDLKQSQRDRLIKRLSDTLSNLVKLNHGEFRKYHLNSLKKLTYILFFKDTSI